MQRCIQAKSIGMTAKNSGLKVELIDIHTGRVGRRVEWCRKRCCAQIWIHWQAIYLRKKQRSSHEIRQFSNSGPPTLPPFVQIDGIHSFEWGTSRKYENKLWLCFIVETAAEIRQWNGSWNRRLFMTISDRKCQASTWFIETMLSVYSD